MLKHTPPTHIPIYKFTCLDLPSINNSWSTQFKQTNLGVVYKGLTKGKVTLCTALLISAVLYKINNSTCSFKIFIWFNFVEYLMKMNEKYVAYIL